MERTALNVSIFNNDDKWFDCASDNSDECPVSFRGTSIRSVSSIVAEDCLIGLEYHNNGEYWFNLMKKIWVMRERS
ncbi:unnamed protein product [Rhizophagus irregularis]|nr:unnamed protein product [Rhizophagus irregularis]